MRYFSSDFKLGILGGGQLGKMLLNETGRYDIYTKVLDSSDLAVARHGCNEFKVGDLMDYRGVYEFGKTVDLLTYEIEHINIDALEALEREGVRVFPSVSTLKIIQNKINQKLFYRANDIPTADFMVFSDKKPLVESLANGGWLYPFVWKSDRFGYDGMGVKIVRNEKGLDDLPEGACIAERLIDFKHELAVIVARNASGEVAVYPPVEMAFHPEANQVEYVICPARVSEEIEAKAKNLALKVSKAFRHVGLLAVEMFITSAGEALVNEVAPRPHNSGHFSIEASYTNQFDQHLRAILDLPLGDVRTKAAAVMANLVGEEGYRGEAIYKNLEAVFQAEGATLHIYGKRQTKPFRKMGHITVLDPSIDNALDKARQLKKMVKVIGTQKI